MPRKAIWTVLLAISCVMLFPVLWMALTALRPASETFARDIHLVPSRLMWSNLRHAWLTYPISAWLMNSIVVAVLGGALALALNLMAGYAFAKFTFRGRDLLFYVFLGTMMLPTQVYMVPQFMTVAALGGVNSLWAVVIPKAAETYGIFLARQFFLSMPEELLDAARLDGASEWRIFWRIVLPLNKPVVAILGLLLVLGYWNEFGWPLAVLKDERSLTLPVGLSFLQGEHVTDWPGLMTIALVSVAPIMLLFLFLQRYFIRGISRSAIK